MNSEKYTFFWRDVSPFSQWYRSSFVVDGVTFKTAEHYMMWKKAMFFSDIEAAEEVLHTDHPRDVKAIGRRVKNFNNRKWAEVCKEFVYKGNYEKFTQNKELLKQLMNTGNTTLVEASPYDKIWGIGMDEETARKTPESKWNGTNWLGEILTKLRDHLLIGRSNP